MINYDWRVFNPLYWHIIDAMANEDIRFILVYGGSSAAKTYSFTQALINDALENQASALSMRKYSVDISESTYADAKEIGQKIDEFTNNFEFLINKIKIGNAQIRFRGLDQSHKLQGISKFKRIYADEITHFIFDDWKQMKKRLRGKPGQQIMASWNPVSVNAWINKKVIEKEEWTVLPNELPGNIRSKLYSDGTIEENSFKKINKSGNILLIKTTYRDNWWIVGHPTKKLLPDGKEYGFIDKHVLEDFDYDKIHDTNSYDVMANGNWGILTERLAFRPSEWSIIDEIPEKAKRIPSGLDFGWNPDPTAVCDFYIYENYLIWDELVYETELNNARQFDKEGIEVGKSIQERLEDQGFDKNHLIVAESQERKSIEELRIAGFSIYAVKKKKVIEGMKLLKKYKHLITRHSTNVIYEFRNYQKCVDRDGNILNEYMDCDNHCFVGNTKIWTNTGEKKIKNIHPGQYVRTSKGWNKVLKKWDNGIKKTYLYSMQFDTFSLSLCCTKDHKIKVNNAWIEIRKLEPGMMVCLFNPSMEKNTNYMQERGTFREVVKDCILRYGNIITGQFQKVTMFIIKTKTRLTTQSKTLNLSTEASIYQITRRHIVKIIQNGLKTFTLKESLRQSVGINQQRVKNGISSKGKQENQRLGIMAKGYVKSANVNLKQKSQSINSVQINANHNIEEIIKQTGLIPNAVVVEKSLQEINMVEVELARLFVEEGSTEPVYDLTIEGSHEYFANGILVHNCMDLARYIQFMKGMLW